MPYIVGVLQEEQARLLSQMNDYMNEMAKLPHIGGNIVEKQISGNVCYYYTYNEGNKTINEIIQKNLDEFKKMLAERDRILKIISGIEEDLAIIDKALVGVVPNERTNQTIQRNA